MTVRSIYWNRRFGMNKRDSKKRHDTKGTAPSTDDAVCELVTRHLRFGWWSLLLFLTVGILLESMHGFKVQWYIGEQNATRRLMWTLAHAHGTLLSLIHIAYAASIYSVGRVLVFSSTQSRCLSIGTILMPIGFFAGGWSTYDGDPGLGILAVPLGAACLLYTSDAADE